MPELGSAWVSEGEASANYRFFVERFSEFHKGGNSVATHTHIEKKNQKKHTVRKKTSNVAGNTTSFLEFSWSWYCS